MAFERGGKNILSNPFVNDVLSKVLDSEDEEQDQHDTDIEIEPQEDLDLDATPIHIQKPKWAQYLIKETGNVVGEPYDRRRMRSQYHNEHVALSHSVSLPIVR